MIRMRTLIKQLWIRSKEILSNEWGNSGYVDRTAIFENEELARRTCEEYLKSGYEKSRCPYCDGELIVSKIEPKHRRYRPDVYKTPPPGAKDLKILVSKGEHEWFVEWIYKCQKCGAKYRSRLENDFQRKRYCSSVSLHGLSEEKSGCFSVVLYLAFLGGTVLFLLWLLLWHFV